MSLLFCELDTGYDMGSTMQGYRIALYLRQDFASALVFTLTDKFTLWPLRLTPPLGLEPFNTLD
jgi:hypothetical protein